MATTNSDGIEVSNLSPEARKALFDANDKNTRDPFETEEGSAARYFKGVLYGNPGCGKTVLAGRLSLPSEKILYVDCEDSSSVLIEHPDWFKGRVKVDNFYGWLESAFLLEKVVREGIYKTVVFDSLQSAFRMEMTSIVNSRASRKQPGKEINPNKDQYEIAEYGIYLNRLSTFVGSALRKPLNIIINGHVNEPTDIQLTNGQKRRVTGSDNQVQAITSLIGNIFYMELVEGGPGVMKTAIQTREDDRVFARTRINALPNRLSSDNLIKAIHNWRQGKPIEVQK